MRHFIQSDSVRKVSTQSIHSHCIGEGGEGDSCLLLGGLSLVYYGEGEREGQGESGRKEMRRFGLVWNRLESFGMELDERDDMWYMVYVCNVALF